LNFFQTETLPDECRSWVNLDRIALSATCPVTPVGNRTPDNLDGGLVRANRLGASQRLAKENAARRRILNSNLMIVDQAAFDIALKGVLKSPSSSSYPDRSKCAHGSDPDAPRPLAIRRHNSSTSATLP
jgi:hypothetical protein